MSSTSPVLVFGGTFDPPTVAHVQMPLLAGEVMEAQRIIFVPAHVSPHKVNAPPASADHRIQMLQLAIADHPSIDLDLIEIEAGGTSYAIDTITTLQGHFGATIPLRLLIGDDQAVVFNTWRAWERIISISPPAVMPRVCNTAAAFADLLRHQGSWTPQEIVRWTSWRLDLPIIDATSTEARSLIAEGEDGADLLDPAVLAYIQEHDLYR